MIVPGLSFLQCLDAVGWATCKNTIIIMPHRSTTYVDAAYCYRPSSTVCRSVTVVSPTKMTSPIEMPFGLGTRMGPRNHVLVEWMSCVPDPPMGRGKFEAGKGALHCKL